MVQLFTLVLVIATLFVTLFGLAQLWAVKIVYGQRGLPPQRRAVWATPLVVIGWTCFGFGALGVLATISGALAPLLLLPLGVVMAVIIARRRRLETRALLKMLGTACEKRIPLPHVVRAYAADQYGTLRGRALGLAALLEAGVPLAEAMHSSGVSRADDIQAALSVGTLTGNPGRALQGVFDDDWQETASPKAERLIYFLFVVAGLSCVTAIVPQWLLRTTRAIFAEMDFALSNPFYQAIDAVSERYLHLGLLWVPIALFLAFLCVAAVLIYTDLLPRNFPGYAYLTLPSHAARIMQSLATGVDASLPVERVLAHLAAEHPVHAVRRRLDSVCESVRAGRSWVDSLRQAKLLDAREAAVIESAERMDNLAWGLRELANRRRARFSRRWQAALSTFLFAVLVACGAIILLVCLQMTLPLVQMIEELT